MKYKLGLAVITVLFFGAICLGAPITYTFTGTLVSSSIADLGSSISGSFTYDTDANIQSDMGSYVIYDAISFAVNTSGHSFAANNSNVLIADNWMIFLAPQDGYSIGGYEIVSSIEYTPYSIVMNMLSFDTNILSSTELVTLPLGVMPTLYFMKEEGSFIDDARYRIENIEVVNAAPVPEPGTLVLLVTGFLMVVAPRMWKNKR